MGDQNFCTRGARRVQPSAGGGLHCLHRLEGSCAALQTFGHRARRRQHICFILVAQSAQRTVGVSEQANEAEPEQV